MMSVATQPKLIAKRQKPSQRKGPQPKSPARDNQPQNNQPRTPSTPLKPTMGKNPIKQQVRIPGHRG